ncbi:MAG: hypothetical protein Q9164_004933 [Protoblastenia rupestris]
MFRSLIPRLPSSSLAHLPVNASSDALKAARLEKLTVMRQIAPIQHHRQAGTTAPTDVADAAKRLAALRITERRRRVAAHIDKRPATVKFTSSKPTRPLIIKKTRATVKTTSNPLKRKYGVVVLNRPERPYRGWRPLGLTDLHYISDKVWSTPSRIPSGPDSDWIMLDHPTVRELKRQNRVFTPPRKRRGFADYHPCNPHITSKTFITKPREWATTPCEEGNDYSRPSKVIIQSLQIVKNSNRGMRGPGLSETTKRTTLPDWPR